MFDLPMHPKIVHFPIALAVLMPAISFGLLVSWWRGWFPARTWWVAVVLQAILFGTAWWAMEVGEEEEEHVEDVLPNEHLLHEHAERAEALVWTAGGVLVVMALPLFIPGDGRKRWVATGATAATVAVTVLAFLTGEAGGDLVYKQGAANAWIKKSGPAATKPAPSGDATRPSKDGDGD